MYSDPHTKVPDRRIPIFDRIAASGETVVMVRPDGFGKTSLLDAMQRHAGARAVRYDMRSLSGTDTRTIARTLDPLRLIRRIRSAQSQATGGSGAIVLIDDCNAPATDAAALEALRRFYRALGDNMPRPGAVVITDRAAPHPDITEAMGGRLTDIGTMREYASLCGITRSDAGSDGIGAWMRCGGYRYHPEAEPVAPCGPYYSALGGNPDPMGAWLRPLPSREAAWSVASVISREGAIVCPGAMEEETRELVYAGYLTIAGADPHFGIVRYAFANADAERIFYTRLLADAAQKPLPYSDIREAFLSGNPETALRILQSLLGAMPYIMTRCHTEADYQTLLFGALRLAGLEATAEAATSGGRIDIEVATPDYIYILELKRNRLPDTALRQIAVKGYADRHGTDPREIIAVGIEFSSSSSNMSRWSVRHIGKEDRS